MILIAQSSIMKSQVQVLKNEYNKNFQDINPTAIRIIPKTANIWGRYFFSNSIFYNLPKYCSNFCLWTKAPVQRSTNFPDVSNNKKVGVAFS